MEIRPETIAQIRTLKKTLRPKIKLLSLVRKQNIRCEELEHQYFQIRNEITNLVNKELWQRMELSGNIPSWELVSLTKKLNRLAGKLY